MIIVGLLALLLATYPLFFEIYRTAAFHTVPRDDYASYLLFLIGNGGELPEAPFMYRVLSVVVAIPFYYVLPLYRFTYLPAVDSDYLKAMEALSFVSYLSILLTGWVMYVIARKYFNASRASSMIIGLLSLIFSRFCFTVGVDPFGMFIISLLVLWLPRSVPFSCLVILSAGMNEKIPIIFLTILATRALTSMARHQSFMYSRQLAAAAVGVAAYIGMRLLVDAPGVDSQTDPSLFLAHLQWSLSLIMTFKGALLIVCPVLLLCVLMAFAARSERFQRADVSGAVVLLALAMLANVEYSAGRIAMYSYPLYLPAVATTLDDLFRVPQEAARVA